MKQFCLSCVVFNLWGGWGTGADQMILTWIIKIWFRGVQEFLKVEHGPVQMCWRNHNLFHVLWFLFLQHHRNFSGHQSRVDLCITSRSLVAHRQQVMYEWIKWACPTPLHVVLKLTCIQFSLRLAKNLGPDSQLMCTFILIHLLHYAVACGCRREVCLQIMHIKKE